jgi:hypothetical protein
MTPHLIIEVLDGRDGVRARSRVESLPATIGRGYANDVILDDPYVCPTHVRISATETGELVAEDTGSVNGVHVGRGQERIARVVLRPGMELRVGRSIIRCAYPEQPVAATLVDARRHPPTARASLDSGLGRVAMIAGALLLIAISAYSGSAKRNGASDAVTTVVGAFALLSVWCGAWALASRVVSQRFAFMRHFAFASLVAAAVTAYGTVNQWAIFLVPSESLSAVFGGAGTLAAFALLLYGHLGIASAMSRAQRARTALAITGVVIAIFVTYSMVDDRTFTTKMSYESQLKPAPPALVPTISVQRFITDARMLRDDVDQMLSDSSAANASP